MFGDLIKIFKDFSVNFVNEFGAEKYSEQKIGNLDSYNAVNGGGFLSSIKTEVEVGGVKYIIEGGLNGVPLGKTVILRHWPKTAPKGLKYLLIDGSRFRVAS
jgi:hypothetical protein